MGTSPRATKYAMLILPQGVTDSLASTVETGQAARDSLGQ